jgi:GT2 family glycosyltransferase
LNDDVRILPLGLSTLLQDSREFSDKSIICGACEAKDGSVSYSGYIKKHKKLIPDGHPVRCDYFNGNMVLVPNHVFYKIGNLDPIFHHGQGDFDYGLRAKKKGIHSYIGSIVTGKCERSLTLPVWCNPAFSIHERYRSFKSPLGGRPRTTFIFQYRHLGLMPALFHYFTIYLRLFFPDQYNRKKASKPKERIKNLNF